VAIGKKANLLMLARPPDAQKPSPALSFQNTEQGFFAFQFDGGKSKRARNSSSASSSVFARTTAARRYGFAGVAAGAGAAAAAGGAAAPPSFGVAR